LLALLEVCLRPTEEYLCLIKEFSMSEQIISQAPFKQIRTTSFALLMAGFIFISVLTAGAWVLLASTTKDAPIDQAPKVETTSITLPQGNSSPQRIETELIKIGPNGFEPAEITRPEGRFLLAIQNRSGLAEIALQVSREDSHARFLIPTRKKRQDWRDVIAPPPGRYVLTEANHPEWHCLITITAR
jgi:hypothetical protein